MSAYTEVLKTPGVARIISAQLTARFPAGMYALGFLLHIQQQHDSYAAAGLVLAAVSIGQAVAGPVTTRLMGSWGTRRMLALTLVISIASLLGIALVPLPLWADIVLGAVAGLSMPPIMPAVRTLYPTMVPQKLLAPLFSLDATLQELIWIIGPVAITFISTTIDTVTGLLVAAVIQVGGGLWFILSPEVGRLRIPPSKRKLGRVLAKPPVLLTVVAGALLIGSFSSMEAGVVAIFGHGSADAGIVLAASAVGSLAGGLTFGHLPITKWSLARRSLITLVGMVMAIFLVDFWGLSMSVFVAGVGCAPALSAMSSIVAGTVKFSDTPEAYGWVGSGQLIGAALGSAAAGFLIDEHGGPGALWVAAGMAVLATVIPAIFRRHQPDLRAGIEAPLETAPLDLPR